MIKKKKKTWLSNSREENKVSSRSPLLVQEVIFLIWSWSHGGLDSRCPRTRRAPFHAVGELSGCCWWKSWRAASPKRLEKDLRFVLWSVTFASGWHYEGQLLLISWPLEVTQRWRRVPVFNSDVVAFKVIDARVQGTQPLQVKTMDGWFQQQERPRFTPLWPLVLNLTEGIDSPSKVTCLASDQSNSDQVDDNDKWTSCFGLIKEFLNVVVLSRNSVYVQQLQESAVWCGTDADLWQKLLQVRIVAVVQSTCGLSLQRMRTENETGWFWDGYQKSACEKGSLGV